MSEETPRVWCPECEAERDPLTEMLEERYCGRHSPSAAGSGEHAATVLGAVPPESATGKALCDLLHSRYRPHKIRGPRMSSLTVVGEFGSCHEESLARALAGVDVAKSAGCSAYKVQYWGDPLAMRRRRNVAIPSAYQRGSIRPEWFSKLLLTAHDVGIDFICTVYLPEDVALVSQYVDAFKVASFEAMDTALIDAIQKVRGTRRLYVSTGMCTQEDIAPLEHLTGVDLLHCVSAYPCPIDEANLGAIPRGGGYSDHTRCAMTGGLAVAAGADVLEVHYRLEDTSPACPDYVVALSPADLAAYTDFARLAYRARGSGQKIPQAAEVDMLPYRVRG